MKARPILFSAPMIRALLDSRKTQTRRIVKPQPQLSPHHEPVRAESRGDRRWVFMTHTDRPDYGWATGDVLCPYGVAGDLLWARETFGVALAKGELMMDPPLPEADEFVYRADYGNEDELPWKPSIHMPRRASRLTLRITNIRVERLNEISDADAIAEGVEPLESSAPENRESCDFDRSLCIKCGGLRLYMAVINGAAAFDTDCEQCDTHAKRYRWLWESINGAESWTRNDWVWAISFEVIQANVDQVLKREAA